MKLGPLRKLMAALLPALDKIAEESEEAGLMALPPAAGGIPRASSNGLHPHDSARAR